MATQQVQQGWSQMTAAAQQIIRSGLGAARSIGRATRSRKRASSSKGARATRPKKRARSSTSRKTSSRRAVMKKGSAAAKAWGKKMAKLRK